VPGVVFVEPTQYRPVPQSADLLHGSPCGAKLEHVVTDVMQLSTWPHVVSVRHEAPATGAAAHVPQPAPGTIAQNPVWHCPGNAHGSPLARDPVACTHEGGGLSSRRSVHDSVAYACAHASLRAAVFPLEGAAMALRQLSFRRVSHAPSLP
jgi:hypothetical protein